MRALQEVILAMQGGQWEMALELYTAAKSEWVELKKNHDLRSEPPKSLFVSLLPKTVSADC